jgi:hypothetical protein
VPAEVDDLEQASQMVAKVAWGNEPVVAVGEAIEAMSRSRNTQDAALLMAVRSFSARGEHRADGHVNVAAWLQHTCHLKKRQALRLARLSRFLDHQPVLEEAMAEGRISLDHLELFADLHRERFAGRVDRGLSVVGGLRDGGPVRGRGPPGPTLRRRPGPEGCR